MRRVSFPWLSPGTKPGLTMKRADVPMHWMQCVRVIKAFKRRPKLEGSVSDLEAGSSARGVFGGQEVGSGPRSELRF